MLQAHIRKRPSVTAVAPGGGLQGGKRGAKRHTRTVGNNTSRDTRDFLFTLSCGPGQKETRMFISLSQL